MRNAFVEGQYLIALIGTDVGTVMCENLAHMQAKVGDLFPEETVLLDADVWETRPDDDFPYHIAHGVLDERGWSVVHIFRLGPISV